MQKLLLTKQVLIQKFSVKNGLQILSKAFQNRLNYSDFINKHTEIKKIVSHKGFVFRIYPTSEQKNFIHQNIGCRRKIYNIYVDFLYKYLEKISFEKGFINEKELFGLLPSPKFLKNLPEYSFLNQADSLALCNAKIDFSNAVKKYNNFFVKKKGNPYKKKSLKQVQTIGKPLTFRDLKGLPHFSAKWFSEQSFTTNNQQGTVSLGGNENGNKGKNENFESSKRFSFLKIPKLKNGIKLRLHRQIPINGKIKNCTITRKNDVYRATILVESVEFCRKFKQSEETLTCLKELLANNKNLALGLDYSQKTGCVGSDLFSNDLIFFEKIYRKHEKKLAALQRKLAKKEKPCYKEKFFGSKTYQKFRQRISKLQGKIADFRQNTLHILSKKLTEKYLLIGVEDLNLQGLSQSLKLAKNLLDNGFGMFRDFLQYKIKDLGRIFWKVDKFYPSSQLCHVCGFQNPATRDLNLREFECPACHELLDRDENAAQNIRGFAIETFSFA